MAVKPCIDVLVEDKADILMTAAWQAHDKCPCFSHLLFVGIVYKTCIAEINLGF